MGRRSNGQRPERIDAGYRKEHGIVEEQVRGQQERGEHQRRQAGVPISASGPGGGRQQPRQATMSAAAVAATKPASRLKEPIEQRSREP